MLIRYFYGNRIYEENFTQPFVEGGLPGHVDLHRLRQGQSGGAFWSLFAPCPANGSDFSDENYASSKSDCVHAHYQMLTIRRRSVHPGPD